MLVWEIQAQYAAARESGDTDTIEKAREIAKAEAHAVAISEGDGDEAEYTRISAEYTRISEATFAKVSAETLLSARRVKTTPRSPRSRK